MTTYEIRIAEKRQKIEDLKQEKLNLRLETARLESLLKVKNTRLRELENGFHRTGLIQSAINDLKHLELKQADSKRPKVIWETTPEHFLCIQGRVSVWIVDKVTKKRIYVREPGCQKSEYYNHDGTHRWSTTVIDISKTFPEGLKCTKT